MKKLLTTISFLAWILSMNPSYAKSCFEMKNIVDAQDCQYATVVNPIRQKVENEFNSLISAMTKRGSEGIDSLNEAQKGWLMYSEYQCQFIADQISSEKGWRDQTSCLVYFSNDRLKTLRAIREDFDKP